MRLSIALIILSLVPLSLQHCCYGDDFECVGYCNKNCCHCIGECKCITDEFGRCNYRNLRPFTAIDTNKDGLMSEEEGAAYINATNGHPPKNRDWFVRLDKNGDGFVQPGEFVKSLE